jgi:hypothetical protein
VSGFVHLTLPVGQAELAETIVDGLGYEDIYALIREIDIQAADTEFTEGLLKLAQEIKEQDEES